MSKFNTLVNDYITSEYMYYNNIRVGGYSNLVLTGNTITLEAGGQLVNQEPGQWYTDTVQPYRGLARMADGSMITLGGNYGTFNLYYAGNWRQGNVAGVRFEHGNGNGLVNFTAHTGGDVAGTDQADANSAVSDSGIKIAITNSFTNAWATNGTRGMSTTNDISSYAFKANGQLTVKSDMSALIHTDSGLSRGNDMNGYYVVGSSITYFNLSSNNTVESAAFKANSLVFDNNFTGTLNSGSSLNAWGYTTPTASSNTVVAAGVLSAASVTLGNGYWGGSITAYSGGNNFHADKDLCTALTKTLTAAAANNNLVGAYGIKADSVTIKDFTGTISAVVSDNDFTAHAEPGSSSSSTVQGNEIAAAAVKAANVTIDGNFTGSFYAENSDLSMAASGGANTTYYGSNTVTVHGFDVSGTLACNGNMRGSLTLAESGLKLRGSSYIYAYGIEAPTIRVGGYLDTDIAISQQVAAGFAGGFSYGISTTTLTAQAFTGNITVVSTSSRSTGMMLRNGFENGNDGIFDFAGTIDTSNSDFSIGMEGFYNGMNLRVSGSILADPADPTFSYALFAGTFWLVGGPDVYEVVNVRGVDAIIYNRNDYLEVAAGAVIQGNIDLTNGENNMFVDSNARITGSVYATGGKLNLTFMLNDKAMPGVAAGAGAVITSGNSGIALESVASLTVNLNDVVLDVDAAGAQTAKTYYLVSDGNSSQWQTRTITFAYQGQLIAAKVGQAATARDGSFSVVSGYDTNGLYVTVKALKEKNDYLTPNASATWSNNDGTITVSWDAVADVESYELEYRIAEDGVHYGASITVMLDGAVSGYTLDNIEDNQKVQWRVRRHYGTRTNFSDWTDIVEGDADTKHSTITLGQHEYSVDSDNALATINNPDSEYNTSSSTIEFQWSGFECSDGLGYYEVRYYLSNEEETPDWNAMQFGTTENYYHKYTTTSEIVVSGFNNAEYVHWQVRAIDINGLEGDWVNGDIFRVFIGDNRPPVFDGAGAAVSYDVTKAADEVGFLKVTLTWDPAVETDGKSGLRGYYISYRQEGATEWTMIGMVPAGTNTFAYELANGNYEWQIFATDYAGNTSAKYTGVWHGDDIAPTFGGSANWSGAWDAENEIVVFSGNWSKAVDGESGLAGYRLRYSDLNGDGSWYTVIFDPAVQSTTVSVKNGEYKWVLEAFDYAGNYTAVAGGQNWEGDLAAPQFINPDYAFANVREDAAGATVIDFLWSTAYEQRTAIRTGFSHYTIKANIGGNEVTLGTVYNQKTNMITVNAASFGLTPNNYTWWVEAYDIGGNKATASNGNFIIDVTPPSGSFGDDTTNTLNATWLSRYVLNEKTGLYVEEYYVSDISITFDFDGYYTDDLSGVVYQVQICDNATFSGASLKNYYTTTDALVFDAGTGTRSGHEDAGELLGMNNIYWRVQALDGSGNHARTWLLGNNGNAFKLQDYNNLNADQEPRRVVDNTAPSMASSTQVEFSWDYDGGLSISWEGGTDAFGIEYYTVRLVREGSYPNDLPLIGDEDPSVYYYTNVAKITRPAGNTYTIRTQTGENWLHVANLPDGIYSLQVQAHDYAGLYSEWSTLEKSITIDVHGPTLDITSVKNAVAGNDVYFTWNSAVDLVGVDHYDLTYKMYNQTTQAYEKVQTITIAGDATSFWLHNIENGDYCFTLQAFDKKLDGSNIFGITEFGSDISKNSMFTVGGTGDASDYRTNPTMMTDGKTYNDAVGYADMADYYGFKLDAESSVVFDFSNVVTLGGGNTGIKVTFYDANGKTIKTATVGSGDKSYAFSWAAGLYTVGIAPANSAKTISYSISASSDAFPAATHYDDESNFKNGTLKAESLVENTATGDGELRLSGWVGYNDGADFFYVKNTARAGGLTLDISGIDTTLVVTLYDANKKKLKSITVKEDATLLNNYLVSGDFYISVATSDKGKGAYNSNYILDLVESYFPAANHRDDSFSGAQSVKLDDNGVASVADWVGYNDAVDYFAVSADRSGKVALNISGVQSKLVVTLYDENRKKLKTVNVKEDGLVFSDLYLGGAFYVSVAAPDKGKGGYNSDYQLNFVSEYVQPDSVANDTFKDAYATPVRFQPDSTAEVSGWVGVGDPTDIHMFETDAPGRINLVLGDVESKLKISVYNSRRQLVKSITVSKDGEYLSDLLIDGDFYIQVSSGDGGKKLNSTYSLTVQAAFFPTETQPNNTLSSATDLRSPGGAGGALASGVVTPWDGAQAIVDDWVGYGDAADYFEFEMTEAGRIDFDLDLDEANFKVGKQVKITLFDEAGKKLKLSSDLISGELAVGKYCVAIETSNDKKYSTGYRLDMSIC